IRLADREIDVDRIGLDDSRQHRGRGTAADIIADRYLARRHDAVIGRRHAGIAVIDLRKSRIDLSLLQAGLRIIPAGGGIIERRLGSGLADDELGLPLILELSLDARCLGARLRRLRLLELELVGLRLDGEQKSTLLHLVAIAIIDGVDETRYTRDQVAAVDCR